MKKTIRIIAIMLLLATVLMLVASCESTPAAENTSEEPTQAEITTSPEATTSEITTAEATTAEVTTAAPEAVIIEPDSIHEKKLFYTEGNREADVANGRVFVYTVVKGRDYYLTTSLTAQDPGFPLVVYLNSKSKVIGTEFMNTPGKYIGVEEEKLTVPADASVIFVNARGVDAVMATGKNPKPAQTEPVAADVTASKDISILFVGNSLTQDGIAYLPYVLKHYYPEVNFRFYMWYSGGKTLAQHYADFTNDTACDIFSVAENSDKWSNSSKKMSWILQNYKFDIVCMQEYFNYKSDYATVDLGDWNNCKNYIVKNYKGGNGLEFISLLHAPKRDRADAIFDLTKKGNELILKETIADDIIPVGLAVVNAMSTTLDKLGDQQHLSPDGTHTQEGLPCLVQTYVALLWLFDRLGVNKSIYGLPFKVTQTVYNTIQVPGANLGSGVITGTDAENLLAQEIAIKTYKEAKKMFD